MIKLTSYGPHNFYPLSKMRVELAGECEDPQEFYMAESVMPMQEIYQRLNTTSEQIARFCEKWRLAELALFGSVLRNDFRVDSNNPSDIDLLFSYLPGSNMSLLRRSKMKVELEALLKRNVDLLMTAEVLDSHNPIRKKQILESAQVIYAQR
jgi:uncharacterized protein